ncbi:HAD family hydrolase [Tenacibaculum jejuense]|uniref:Putative HAD superfamily hydrolase n=1 Tax=Tenacibaculum jejuense TaxID=584609 RepID=A0A238U5Y4_9FLAO|nr:HAD family hydrolase [Tenacibaculum jejuense]SNR14416.1 putative HAD superfamily hydrolase [Tenacibaculum jejuense]
MILIFDLDNTLIDRNKAYWLWLQNNVLYKCKTVDKSLILYYDNWGYTSRHHFYNWLIQKYELSISSDELIEKCANELHQYISKNQETLIILKRLKEQCKIVIGTNGGIQNQTNKLKATGILPYVDHVYISEHIGCKKPNPNFYKHIQNDLNCLSSEIMMIGDHYNQDFLVPKKLGWKSIWLSHNSTLIHDNKICALKDLIPYLRENKLLFSS